ncbi:hypothetical protein MO973_01835 [Paenibacillus sp. TRM 82003]|nr:hypothetical protein [Paenibacillus sp. TRM 82003]
MRTVEVTFAMSYQDYLHLNEWHSRKSRIALQAAYVIIYLGVILYQTGSVASLLDPLVIGIGVAVYLFSSLVSHQVVGYRELPEDLGITKSPCVEP